MFHIQDTIVSRDLADVFFCCDLEACKGACCIEGESGAPLLEAEREAICKAFPLVQHLLPQQNRAYIEQHGLMYYDQDDDLVTQIIHGRECVFTCFEKDGSCRCAFEKGFSQGCNPVFYKPISCHLYPIRLTKYKDFIAVNYHHWPICNAALVKGKQEGIRLYKFVKGPLIRAFGEQWHNELDKEIQQYLQQQTCPNNG